MGDLSLMVIGVDCAADPANVGLARGVFRDGRVTVTDLACGSKAPSPADIVGGWLAGGGPALLAFDAPLGWPRRLGNALSAHRAGQALALDPPNPQPDPGRPGFLRDSDLMFRRETDRFVRERLGQQPLDVGADRIARAAMAALELLGELRARARAPIELAWAPAGHEGPRAIEVYPAATLRAHGIPHRGYKRPDQGAELAKILVGLGQKLELAWDTGPREISSHMLDAAVCLLAAQDFLTGAAMPPPPELEEAARREGWIWVRGGLERPQAPKPQRI